MRACIASQPPLGSATSVDARFYFIHIKSPLTLTMTAQNSLKMETTFGASCFLYFIDRKTQNTQEAGDA